MKKTSIYSLIGIAVLVLAAIVFFSTMLSGCMSNPSGSAYQNGAVPNKFESSIYDIHTNVVTVTNTVTVEKPVYVTNGVPLFITNQLNQTITTFSNFVVTNFIPVQVPVLAQQTNYDRTIKESVVADAKMGAAAINTFAPGMGNLTYAGVMAVAGFFAWLRSSKNGTKTTTALTQEVETVREFVKALPNGQTYDNALVGFLQAHQAEAGIAQQVVGALENYVSNPDAKVAAQEVINGINALRTTATPIAPVSSAPA